MIDGVHGDRVAWLFVAHLVAQYRYFHTDRSLLVEVGYIVSCARRGSPFHQHRSIESEREWIINGDGFCEGAEILVLTSLEVILDRVKCRFHPEDAVRIGWIEHLPRAILQECIECIVGGGWKSNIDCPVSI